MWGTDADIKELVEELEKTREYLQTAKDEIINLREYCYDLETRLADTEQNIIDNELYIQCVEDHENKLEEENKRLKKIIKSFESGEMIAGNKRGD